MKVEEVQISNDDEIMEEFERMRRKANEILE